jgi:gliding motility-associated-like protein
MFFRPNPLLYAAFFCLLALGLAAQTKRANQWCFGNGFILDFNATPPALTPGAWMSQLEGSASISDDAGQLLFYTDGITIRTRQHRAMPNGLDLKGDQTSSQSALIVPQPGSTSVFYVFTVPAWGDPQRVGLRYSVVDMRLNNGLGDVVPDRKNILLMAPATEKLAATLHGNGQDVWVVTSRSSTNVFHAYLVTREGIHPCPVVSEAGQIQLQAQGYLKFSPDGTWLAAAEAISDMELFRFDACTGVITLAERIPASGNDFPDGSHSYGVSFSPDNSKLYVSSGWIGVNGCPKVFQYDLKAPDLAGSRVVLYDDVKAAGLPCTSWGVGAMQLGPDGKIYVATWNHNYLHVINHPNEAGTKANFIKDAVPLNGTGLLGLPNFIESYFHADPAPRACLSQARPKERLGNDTLLCVGAKLSLNVYRPGAAYAWQDGSTSSTYTIREPGTYWLDYYPPGSKCPERDSLQVSFTECREDLFIPNVFTPNNDGFNDTFEVLGTNGTPWSLTVYNRWGKKVADYPQYANDWRAHGLENGVYYYVLVSQVSRRSFKGWIHVRR